MENNIKECIVSYLIKNQHIDVKLVELSKVLVENGMTQEAFTYGLYELLAEGKVTCTLGVTELYVQTLHEWINGDSNLEHKVILKNYFAGEKLENMTNIEVKRIVKRALKSKTIIEEDKFRDNFMKYQFDMESFTQIYEQPEFVYRYLKECYKKGKINWRAIRYNVECEEKIRHNAIKLMETYGFCEEGKIIDFTIESVIIFLMSSEQLEISEKKIYLKFIEFLDKQKPIPQGLEISFSKFVMILKNMPNIIYTQNGTVRLRDSSVKKDKQLFMRVKWNKYRNQYISAELVYQNEKEQLYESNILNAMEMIYILKRYSDVCEKYNIVIIKSQFIKFGNGDLIEQLKSLLNEMSPVSADVLAREYEQRYGMKSNTVKVRLLKEVSQYARDGIYDTKTRVLTDKQALAISSKLKSSWYFTEEVEKIFKSHIKKLYKEYMSTQNLLQLGYKKTSSVIYASEYSSFFECLLQTEWVEGTFKIDDTLWSISQVYTAVQKKTNTFELIEYSPQKYIKLTLLKQNNIHKKDLLLFIDTINRVVEDNEYFTVKSLRHNGATLSLDYLGFEDTFYYSILKNSKKIQVKKIAGTYLFCKSKKDIGLSGFLEYLLQTIVSIDLFELMEMLQSRYGMNVSLTSMRSALNGTTLYYDNISEKIFIDYHEYYKQI